MGSTFMRLVEVVQKKKLNVILQLKKKMSQEGLI